MPRALPESPLIKQRLGRFVPHCLLCTATPDLVWDTKISTHPLTCTVAPKYSRGTVGLQESLPSPTDDEPQIMVARSKEIHDSTCAIAPRHRLLAVHEDGSLPTTLRLRLRRYIAQWQWSGSI